MPRRTRLTPSEQMFRRTFRSKDLSTRRLPDPQDPFYPKASRFPGLTLPKVGRPPIRSSRRLPGSGGLSVRRLQNRKNIFRNCSAASNKNLIKLLFFRGLNGKSSTNCQPFIHRVLRISNNRSIVRHIAIGIRTTKLIGIRLLRR